MDDKLPDFLVRRRMADAIRSKTMTVPEALTVLMAKNPTPQPGEALSAVVDKSLQVASFEHAEHAEHDQENQPAAGENSPVFEKLPDNVELLNTPTKLSIPVTRILQHALEADLKEIVICGLDSEGYAYFASSESDGGSVLWRLEIAKRDLMEQVAPSSKGDPEDHVA